MKKTRWDDAAADFQAISGKAGSVSQRDYITPRMLDMLGDVRGMDVLDLGCGAGYMSRILARKGAQVTGADISVNLLRPAIAEERRAPLGISYLNLDAESLSGLEDSSFDIVVSNMVLHNVRDVAKSFGECSRVLRKGGRIVFSILHPLSDTLRPQEFERDLLGLFVRLRVYGKPRAIPHRTHWQKGVVLYHRPFCSYFDALFAAGFSVSGFAEIPIRHRSSYAGASPASRLLMKLGNLGIGLLYSDKSARLAATSSVLEFWEQVPAFALIGATKNQM